MAERFSESEKPFVINQPSLEERLKEYPELKTKIESTLSRTRAGMWRKRPKRSGGLSRNCGKWGTRFYTVGPAVRNRKRERSTTPSRA